MRNTYILCLCSEGTEWKPNYGSRAGRLESASFNIRKILTKLELLLSCIKIPKDALGFKILNNVDISLSDNFWIILLAYFPNFDKNKSRLMISPCCLCVCVCPQPPPVTF
jgi:hypothetical protein